jgi:sugar lactone lactonase YvrE
VRTLLTGLVFGESARWHDGRFWACDWGTGEVLRLDAEGESEVVTWVSSYPLCIDWLPDGRMLAVAGGEARVLRRETDGSLVTHADLSRLSEERWNEIAVDDRGFAYVNGGPGVVALVDSAGSARVVADGLAFPNGMAITLDGGTLIVAESHARRLTSFTIGIDGALTRRRAWAELRDGVPDGICLDVEGAVWYADVPNRRCVRVREGGEVLQVVTLDRGCFSCALGADDPALLCVIATEWRGFESMFQGPRSGMVVTVEAPAPGKDDRH